MSRFNSTIYENNRQMAVSVFFFIMKECLGKVRLKSSGLGGSKKNIAAMDEEFRF